jgi:hypothetical protein
MTHQFRGLIKCLNCGKNYKTKTERKKPVYICSGFANYGKEFCSYFPLQEEDLSYTVTKHLMLQNKRIESSLSEHVQVIEVKNTGYRILYNDGTESLINWNGSEYGVKVKY